jgi:hypothetical protein
LYLAGRKADGLGSVLVSQARPLLKEQHEATTLNELNRNGTPPNGVACLLQEIVREGTTSGNWTWHSGFLSFAGLFWNSPPYSKGLS